MKTPLTFVQKFLRKLPFLVATKTVFLSTCSHTDLFSEIKVISFNWTPGLCPQNCEVELERQLRTVPEIENVVINQNGGRISWKPDLQFSFVPINQASRMTGIRILTTRIKVKGKIEESMGNFYIVSSGDNTRIQLLGPIEASVDRYVIQQNIDSHPLTPNIRAQLMEAEKKKQLVSIDGPLFEPERIIILAMIIENITEEKVSEN